MTIMITEVYEAFIEAGASDQKAKAAASAISDYSLQISEIKLDTALIKGNILLLKWMIGFNLAFTATILWKIFS